MSGQRVDAWRDAVLSIDGPTPSTARVVLLALSKFADGFGVASPSLRTLEYCSALRIGTIRKHLRRAVSMGWLEPVRDTPGRAASYRLTIPSGRATRMGTPSALDFAFGEAHAEVFAWTRSDQLTTSERLLLTRLILDAQVGDGRPRIVMIPEKVRLFAREIGQTKETVARDLTSLKRTTLIDEQTTGALRLNVWPPKEDAPALVRWLELRDGPRGRP